MAERCRVYRDADGVRKTMIWDDEDPDRFVIKTEQVLDEILEGIARDREALQTGDNRHAARLPVFIYEDLVKRGIVGDEDAFKKWLNGTEAVPWRIWQGNV